MAVFLTFPIILGIAALFSDSVRAQWQDRHSLLTFFSQYVFVLSMALVGMISSHLVWAAQRQVYQARKLGRYRLEVAIGEGGMNQVWLAWDTSLKRQVALKLLKTEGIPDAPTVRRFEREAHAASKLADPHTIRIFDGTTPWEAEWQATPGETVVTLRPPGWQPKSITLNHSSGLRTELHLERLGAHASQNRQS